MIRVRFPNGQCVTYNDADQLTYDLANGAWKITKRSNGKTPESWFASIQASAGAIVEAVNPCSVSNPVDGVTLVKAIDMLLSDGRSISRYSDKMKLADLKAMLRGFNSTTKTWKPS